MMPAMRKWMVALVLSTVATAVAGPNDHTSDEIKQLEAELRQLQTRQAYFPAVKVARKLYEAQKKVDPADSVWVTRRLDTLAQMLHAAGNTAEAEQVELQLLALAEKQKGPVSDEVHMRLTILHGEYMTGQRWDEDEATVKRMLDITKQLHGVDGTEYSTDLTYLSTMYLQRAQFQQAIQIQHEVLALVEKKAAAPDDMTVVSALMNLSSWEWSGGMRDAAIKDDERMIKLLSSGKQQVSTVAAILGGLASRYHFSYPARDDLAKPLRKQVIDLYKGEVARLEKDKPDDFQLGAAYGQIGWQYYQEEDWPNTQLWMQKSVDFDKKQKRGFSAWSATLAELQVRQGHLREALAMYEDADKQLKSLGSNFGTYAPMMADVELMLNEKGKAIVLVDDYIAKMQKMFATNPAMVGPTEDIASRMYMRAGANDKAEKLLDGALDRYEKELQAVLAGGTEQDHQTYFTTHQNAVDLAVQFQQQYSTQSAVAARLALTTILRRKGRVLDAAAASLASLRKQLSAADKQLLDKLASARAQLAKLTVAGAASDPDYAKDVAALEGEVRKLENELAQKSTAYRVVSQQIELAPVQKRIPADARLVEIVNYQTFDGSMFFGDRKKQIPRKYAAFVVGTSGDPIGIDLGPADAIDKAVEAFRKALADPKNNKVVDLGKALDDLTMAKIIPKLGGATSVLIAPDGALAVVPFSALVDKQGKFLIEKYTFTYLTSGRDLLRVQARTKAAGGGVIFADPSFDGDKAPAKGNNRGARSMDLASLSWPQLPGTGQEADAVEKAMSGLKVYRGLQATEGNVKALHAPKILHLATHGFFLPDEAPPVKQAPGGGQAAPPAAPPQENPLLRSGLALAGANKLESGSDDGILTALEASSLDLEGTKLVVLSACETGVGKVTNGDGVYGLRRALVIAGAQTLVMSLWQVDDQATKDLMAGYYGFLKQGRGKSSGLRDIQLQMLAKDEYKHPFFWASFLPAGDNAPL